MNTDTTTAKKALQQHLRTRHGFHHTAIRGSLKTLEEVHVAQHRCLPPADGHTLEDGV